MTAARVLLSVLCVELLGCSDRPHPLAPREAAPSRSESVAGQQTFPTVDLQVTIEGVKALDQFDTPRQNGRHNSPDFYAEVTIGSLHFSTDPPIEGFDTIRPNWTFAATVQSSQQIPVVIAILDDDLPSSLPDKADLTWHSGRELDLWVSAAKYTECTMSGANNDAFDPRLEASCGVTVTTVGRSKPRAEVRFRIDRLR